MELGSEILEVAGADGAFGPEGKTEKAKRRDNPSRRPAWVGPAGVDDQGMRGEGHRGTWEIPFPPPKGGTAERAEKASDVGEREVGAPQ